MRRMTGALVVAAACAAWGTAAEGGSSALNRLGAGARYWIAVEDIEVDQVLEDGLSWYVTYQLAPTDYFKVEVDVEAMPDEFGGAPETVYAPQLCLVLGNGLYGAAGIGVYYTDGAFVKDPFFTLRAGLDAELLPFVRVDVNVNYRFENWDDLSDVGKDVDSDTLMLGAAVRLCF